MCNRLLSIIMFIITLTACSGPQQNPQRAVTVPSFTSTTTTPTPTITPSTTSKTTPNTKKATPKTVEKAKPKSTTTPKPKPKSTYSCEPDAPPKFRGNIITNKSCGYIDSKGRERSHDPWIDDQLKSARGE